MSSHLALTRLGKLITKQFFENSRLYLFSVSCSCLACLSLVFAFWIMSYRPNYHEEETYIIFVFGLFIIRDHICQYVV